MMIRTGLSLVLAAACAAAGPALGSDWTGAYGGFQFSATGGDASGAADADGSGVLTGVHAGYDVEFGSFVLGAGVDLEFGSIDFGEAVEVDNLARFRLRAGTELGRTFVYGTAGVARVDTSLGSGEGGFAGLGAGWRVGERMTVGGEVIYQSFGDIDGSGVDLDATTASARVTFSF
jgi:outer membrane immunogenic protein